VLFDKGLGKLGWFVGFRVTARKHL